MFLLDSNTKDRIESQELFRQLDGQLNNSQSSLDSEEQRQFTGESMTVDEKMKTQRMQ
jgi:hypothetical protein